jgi:hypothetical protein
MGTPMDQRVVQIWLILFSRSCSGMNAPTSGFALIASFPRIRFDAVDPMSTRDMVDISENGDKWRKGTVIDDE